MAQEALVGQNRYLKRYLAALDAKRANTLVKTTTTAPSPANGPLANLACREYWSDEDQIIEVEAPVYAPEVKEEVDGDDPQHKKQGSSAEAKILERPSSLSLTEGWASGDGAIHTWEPPKDYQVIRWSGSQAGDQGVLFFPWELTNQDYIRRIMEGTTTGIQDKILQLASDCPHRVGSYTGRSQNDIYYLLIHLLGKAKAQHNSMATVTATTVTQEYATEFGCDANKLEDSAKLLIKYTNEVAYVDESALGRKRVEQCFAEAKNLLTLTKSHAMARTIHDLERQYDAHMESKEQRMQAFNLQPPAPLSPTTPTTMAAATHIEPLHKELQAYLENQETRSTVMLYHRLQRVARDFLYMIKKAIERQDDDMALAFLERKQAVEGLLDELKEVPVISGHKACVKRGQDHILYLRSGAEKCRELMDFVTAKEMKEKADELDRLVAAINKDLDPKWSLITHLRKTLLREPESWVAVDLRFVFEAVGPDLSCLMVLLQSVAPDVREIVCGWLEAVGIPLTDPALLSANNEALKAAGTTSGVMILSRAKSICQIIISSTGLRHLILLTTSPRQAPPAMTQVTVPWTPLHEAAAKGRMEDVEALAQHCNSLEPTTPQGMTPLHVAAEAGQLGVVKYLVERGATIHAAESEGHTPLLLAAAEGHMEVVQYLVENGANIQATTSNERLTSLHLASLMGHANMAKFLVHHGANANAGDGDKETPLHLAVHNGHTHVMKVLVEHWANINATNRKKHTPLRVAIDNGHADMAEYLETCGGVA